MEFINGNYRLTFEEDYEGIDINLYQLSDANSPLLYLNLKPLYEINTEYDDRLQVRDIPRYLFKDGDYYQSNVIKYNNSVQFFKISLLNVTQNILFENRTQFEKIKRIFSSSLNCYREETFISINAKSFWEKQFAKSPSFPIFYFEADKRYFLRLN